MVRPPRTPGRRFQLLALLDGTHPAPQHGGGGAPPRWTARDVALVVGLSTFTVLHAFARLRKYGLVLGVESGEKIEVTRTLRSGFKVPVGLPDKTLGWSATDKGRARVAHMGGHRGWCPLCKG